MPMSRGDVVIVAAPGDYGKSRPAVIVQSNAIPDSHASVVICPMTSELAEADFSHHDRARAGKGATGPISSDGRQTGNGPSGADRATDRPARGRGHGAAQRAIEAVGPDMGPARRVDQLAGDAHAVAGFAHAAFEYVAHAQFARHVL